MSVQTTCPYCGRFGSHPPSCLGRENDLLYRLEESEKISSVRAEATEKAEARLAALVEAVGQLPLSDDRDRCGIFNSTGRCRAPWGHDMKAGEHEHVFPDPSIPSVKDVLANLDEAGKARDERLRAEGIVMGLKRASELATKAATEAFEDSTHDDDCCGRALSTLAATLADLSSTKD